MAERLEVERQLKRNRRPNERVAYHEAGHAVASIVLGVSFEYVTIIPVTDAMGRLVFNRPAEITRKMEAGDYKSADVRHWFERELVVAMAGPIAQNERYPQPSEITAFAATLPYSDETAARKILMRVFGNETIAQTYLEFVEAYASVLVDEHWDAIERIALALIEREKLTYDEVVDLLAG